jgi:hypothetical protein
MIISIFPKKEINTAVIPAKHEIRDWLDSLLRTAHDCTVRSMRCSPRLLTDNDVSSAAKGKRTHVWSAEGLL